MKARRPDLVAKLFRGFGDASRLKVLTVLRDGPQSVGDIVARTGLSQPNASMHLACLADCGLVTKERRGRFVDYAIADKSVARLIDDAEDVLARVAGRVARCPKYPEPTREHGKALKQRWPPARR